MSKKALFATGYTLGVATGYTLGTHTGRALAFRYGFSIARFLSPAIVPVVAAYGTYAVTKGVIAAAKTSGGPTARSEVFVAETAYQAFARPLSLLPYVDITREDVYEKVVGKGVGGSGKSFSDLRDELFKPRWSI